MGDEVEFPKMPNPIGISQFKRDQEQNPHRGFQRNLLDLDDDEISRPILRSAYDSFL